MPPFLGGGEMILNVTTDGFVPPPTCRAKFEAGTPPMIAEAVGLGAAVDYLSEIGMDNVRQHEIELTAYALRTLTERYGDKIEIHGPSEPAERGGVLSFVYGEPTCGCIPTTSPRSSIRPACACGPATTAPSRCCRP